MKKRKIMALVLTLALALSGAIPVYAGNDNSKDMEKALLSVKKVIEIPANYGKFSYNFVKSNQSDKETNIWKFSWTKEDDKGRISAEVDENGLMISYGKYNADQTKGIGKLTYEAGQKTGRVFLSKVMPQLEKEMKLTSENMKGTAGSYQYSYKLYKNEVPADFVSATVTVDKFSNEVINYRVEEDSTFTGTLPDKNGVMSQGAVKDLLLSQGAVEMKYFSYYDENTTKIHIYPAYVLIDNNLPIDAKTGIKVNLANNIDYLVSGKGGDSSSYASNKESARDSQLTKVEIEAMAKVNQLLSLDDAKKQAQSFLNQTGYGTTDVKGMNLSEEYIEKGKYFWKIYFEQGSMNINAKTGELNSFYMYDRDEQRGSIITEKVAQEKGETFIKSVLSDEKWKEMKLVENNNQAIPYNSDTPTNYTFSYQRMVNGIPFDSNFVQVNINSATGKVEGYSLDWYDQVKFPNVDKVISPSAAYDVINKTGKMELAYVKNDKGETALVYKFVNHTSFYVDSINGSRVSYNGKEYTENVIPEYTDITGHWAEKTINTLRESGYYIEGTQFSPNSKIKQEAFLRYLFAEPSQAGFNKAEFYEMLNDKGVLLYNEQAPGKEVTRQDAAKIIIRYLGQEKAASYTTIYKNMFTDSVDKNYIGYAALSNAFQIIKGDPKGRFNGHNFITNAEAATIIYRTLDVK